MKFLDPTVAVRDNLSREELRDRLLAADHCISDLDNTDTQTSPAIDVVLERIGVSSTPFGLVKFLNWSLKTGASFADAYVSRDKKQALERAKELRFADYESNFLRVGGRIKGEVESELGNLLSEEYIDQSLFPGTKEFYQKLPAQKMYLSRNIGPIVAAYAVHLGFTDVIAEVKDKHLALEKLIRDDSSLQRLILRVDGVAEDEMIRVAKHYQRRGRLTDVLVLKRSPGLQDDYRNSDVPFNHCDVLMGSDDYGLLRIMNGPAEN